MSALEEWAELERQVLRGFDYGALRTGVSAGYGCVVTSGWDGATVAVEATVEEGFAGFDLVGSPEWRCREVRDRVRAAYLSSGLAWPARRFTVSVQGGQLDQWIDLAIAVAIGKACGLVDAGAFQRVPRASLGLDGSTRFEVVR